MPRTFKLGQMVSIHGFESKGTIIALPYNDKSDTYIVEFDTPQMYAISNDSEPSLHTSVVAESKFLKPIKDNKK